MPARDVPAANVAEIHRVEKSLPPPQNPADVLKFFVGSWKMEGVIDEPKLPAGLEARGAERAVFVDPAPGAVATIRENCRRAKVTKAAMVRRTDALRALRGEKGQFDLVILDPPYRTPPPLLDSVLAELAARRTVTPGGFVVLTRESQSYTPVIPLNWRIERQLSYGDAVILVFQAQ